MRFMMMVKASSESEASQMPTTQELTEMGAYNEELVKAGVLLAADGLLPSSKGARVTFSQQDTQKRTTVTDGPFTEAKELVAGFWIIDVKSLDEAIEWARRVPFVEGEIEVRQVAEADDFGDALTPELRAQEERLRAQTASS